MSRILVGQRVFVLTLAAAAVTVVFLLFWRIGTAPPGFHGDECSIAYNADCIAKTGADEYGVRWPMFFRSFDIYMDPVGVYSAVVPIQVFGLREWAARFPSALYYLMACFAFFLLLRSWRFGPWFALGGSVVLSVIPWVFPMSRNCAYAGLTAAIFGMVTGLVLTDSALRRRSTGRAVLAGLAWAFVIYASRGAGPILALLAVGCGVALWHSLWRRWPVVLAGTLSAVVALLPMVVSMLRFPEALTARFQQVTLTHDPAFLTNVARRYLDYFDVRFLFISGDPELRHHTGWGGELHWFLVPLILCGFYVIIRHWRRQPRYRVILVGFLASPVSAALTVDRMHSARAGYGVVFWLLLAVLGARWLWQRRGLWRKLLWLTMCAGMLEIGLYLHNYFGAYQGRCSFAFQTELGVSLKYCFQHLRDDQVLYISPSTFSPYRSVVDADLKPFLYAYVLFYGKIDPRKYQQTGFPDTIRLYDGHTPKPGLLLQSDYFLFDQPDGHPPYAVLEDEPLPPHARLVKSVQFTKPYAFVHYRIFEIP